MYFIRISTYSNIIILDNTIRGKSSCLEFINMTHGVRAKIGKFESNNS